MVDFSWTKHLFSNKSIDQKRRDDPFKTPISNEINNTYSALLKRLLPYTAYFMG